MLGRDLAKVCASLVVSVGLERWVFMARCMWAVEALEAGGSEGVDALGSAGEVVGVEVGGGAMGGGVRSFC